MFRITVFSLVIAQAAVAEGQPVGVHAEQDNHGLMACEFVTPVNSDSSGFSDSMIRDCYQQDLIWAVD